MLDYETVAAAVQGEPLAAGKVLAYFDGYINRLCTHSYVDEAGRVDYGVDTQMKTQLQGRLLSAMLHFKL